MKELISSHQLELDEINQVKKSENRKEVSVIFQTNSNETEKIKEKLNKTRIEQTKGTIWKAERPKSASLSADIFSTGTELKKRPKSSGFQRRLEKVRPDSVEMKKQKKTLDEKALRYCCCCCRCCSCWQMPESFGSLNLDSQSWSCSSLDVLEEVQTEPWNRFSRSFGAQRKCKSDPNFSRTATKKVLNGERELQKVKRSLRFLGFDLSDFGIDSGGEENVHKKKPEEKSSSFCTKITDRSISLDSLREAVKRAWIDDRLDETHRRLLAQAAYEEWYFRKEKQLWMKRNEEKLMQLKVKRKLQDHFERKKEQAEEEFQKWLLRKRTKRKENEKNSTEKQTKQFDKILKTKEECERAFFKWKKTKEEELEKKKNEKKKEEERKLNSEKEKNTKKIMAEKAFQQWKIKLKETKILEEAKRKKQKKRQEIQEKKREEGFQISFEMWKAVKDEQLKEKTKRMREACKITREERITQMEERMYEAEQAFEDWLEKVDLRKQKQCSEVSSYNKPIPWIPV